LVGVGGGGGVAEETVRMPNGARRPQGKGGRLDNVSAKSSFDERRPPQKDFGRLEAVTERDQGFKTATESQNRSKWTQSGKKGRDGGEKTVNFLEKIGETV